MDGRDLIFFFIGICTGVVTALMATLITNEISTEEKIILDDSIVNLLSNDTINELFPEFIFYYLKLYSSLNLFPQIVIMISLLSFISIITLLLEKMLIKTKLNVVVIMVIVWLSRILLTSFLFFLLNQTLTI